MLGQLQCLGFGGDGFQGLGENLLHPLLVRAYVRAGGVASRKLDGCVEQPASSEAFAVGVVRVVKTLRVKGGGGGAIKAGTKVKGTRLITDGVDGHDIDATVPGSGRMQLKSSVMKKAV